jgi:hypothetical protein
MRGPSRLQLRHALAGELGQVAPSISGTCPLGHQTPRLEVVDQACCTTRRETGGFGKVSHPQLTVRRLGEAHDRRVFARRQTSGTYQISVKSARQRHDYTHERPPQDFLGRREGLNVPHATRITCVGKQPWPFRRDFRESRLPSGGTPRRGPRRRGPNVTEDCGFPGCHRGRQGPKLSAEGDRIRLGTARTLGAIHDRNDYPLDGRLVERP